MMRPKPLPTSDRRRYIGSSDAAAAVGLNPYKSQLELWLEKTNQSSLLLGMLYNDSWVYLEQEQIAGFILVNDHGKILLNYIRPELQQQGIGTALLMNMIDCLREKNIAQITLNSTHTALPFYRKCGFQHHQPQQDETGAALTHLVKYLA